MEIRTAALDNRRENFVVSRPDKLARAIDGYCRFFSTQLNYYSSVIETNSYTLLSSLVGYTPGTLQAIVKGLFEAVGI